MRKFLIIICLFIGVVGCKANKTIEQEKGPEIYLSNLIMDEGEYINLTKLAFNNDIDEKNNIYTISQSVIDITSLSGGEHSIIYEVISEDGEITTKDIKLIVKSPLEKLDDFLKKEILTVDDYLEATKTIYDLEGIEVEDETFGDRLHQFHLLYTKSYFNYNEELGDYVKNKDLFYEDEDFVYLNDKKETIIKYKNLEKKDVIIPNGVKVIGFEAFCQTEIESVDLPSSLEKIEDSAFKFTSLTSLYIPKNVKEIGIEAFDYYDLTDLRISPDNDYFIEKNSGLLSKDGKVFYHLLGNHKEYSIPEGVTVIARMAFSHKHFYSDQQLTSVTIPNSVVIIGKEAFEFNSLESLSLPSSVKAIGMRAFSNNKISKLTLPSNIVEIWPYAFWENDISELSIGSEVKVINHHAFGANDINNIVIPEGVVEISDAAFVSNPSVFVSIPSTVNSIGIEAFSYVNIRSLKIHENNNHYKVFENGLLSKDGTIFYNFIGNVKNYTIPHGVTTISFKALAYRFLNEVTIPNTVTKIEKYAFLENNISKLTIPESVTEIGEGAFYFNNFYEIIIKGDCNRFNDKWSFIGFPNYITPKN